MKYEPESYKNAKYFGALQKFSLHHVQINSISTIAPICRQINTGFLRAVQVRYEN